MDALFLAMVTFFATHVDNVLLYLLLFAGVHEKKAARAMGGGIFFGTFLLLGGSFLFSEFLLTLADSRFLGVLGGIPIFLGLRLLFSGTSKETPPKTFEKERIGFFTLLALTLSSGGDNIAVYIPLFSRFQGIEALPIFLLYALFTGLMIHFSRRFGQLAAVEKMVGRFGHALMPFLFLGLGLYIFWDAGLFRLL